MTLGEAGYRVTVLGIRNRKDTADADLALTTTAPFRHTWIDTLGGSLFSFSKVLSIARRGQQRLARELVAQIGYQSAEALGPAAALLNQARRIPADLTIVHNEAAQWVGLRLLAEGRRVAVDFEDWNSEDLPPCAQKHRPLDLLRRNEQALLHRAAYATTTSEALADGLFVRYGGQRPSVITNSFPLPPLPKRTLRTDDARPPSFFWFSQTIGPGRGLEAFLAAYAKTEISSRLTLLGQVQDTYRQHLLSTLPDALRPRIRFHDLVPPDKLPEVIAQHDIGLALENCTPPNKDLTISNKILQYLGGGLAVVATPTLGQREVLNRKAEAGIILANLDNPKPTAAALDALLADRTALRSRQLAARQLAESHYCWEREAPKLRSLVEHALKS